MSLFTLAWLLLFQLREYIVPGAIVVAGLMIWNASQKRVRP